jgi:hypothetical protein
MVRREELQRFYRTEARVFAENLEVTLNVEDDAVIHIGLIQQT